MLPRIGDLHIVEPRDAAVHKCESKADAVFASDCVTVCLLDEVIEALATDFSLDAIYRDAPCFDVRHQDKCDLSFCEGLRLVGQGRPLLPPAIVPVILKELRVEAGD